MTSRQLVLLLVILIGLGILFTAGKLFMTNPTGAIPSPTPTVTPILTGTFTGALNERVGTTEISITPLEVLEDSRCPLDVQCIQAGTVRLRTNVNNATVELKLNTPYVVENRRVTLINVEPAKRASVQVGAGDYRFTFEIK